MTRIFLQQFSSAYDMFVQIMFMQNKNIALIENIAAMGDGFVSAQLQSIKQAAQDYGVDLNTFTIADFDTAKFRLFIEAVEEQAGPVLAALTAFTLVEGSSSEIELERNLKNFTELLNRMNYEQKKIAAAYPQLSKIRFILDAFLKINRRRKIEERNNNWHTLSGALQKLLGMPYRSEGKYGHKSFGVLTYLLLLSFGQEAQLHQANFNKDGKYFKYIYFRSEMPDKKGVFGVGQDLPEAYNDRIVDIWTPLVDEVVDKLRCQYPEWVSGDYLRRDIAVLHKLLSLDPDNVSTLNLLRHRYKQLHRIAQSAYTPRDRIAEISALRRYLEVFMTIYEKEKDEGQNEYILNEEIAKSYDRLHMNYRDWRQRGFIQQDNSIEQALKTAKEFIRAARARGFSRTAVPQRDIISP